MLMKTLASTTVPVLFLFGGDRPWNASDWTASDDRVRGGISQSYLEVSPTNPDEARFHGTLDIQTLGGAGFASQRTVRDDTNGPWDLSAYEGISLEIVRGDDKKYTLTLADTLLPPDPNNGREQATTSYEYDFEVKKQDGQGHGTEQVFFIPWDAFRATFRGREVEAPPLNTTSVKRISILIRSFFGEQEGPFCLTLKSIAAANSKKPEYD